MPATRITIANNSKQSQKAPLLLPASASFPPENLDSCRALVIKAAQTKLRLKKSSRLFVAGTGRELATAQDWQESIRDDVTLLVSSGEDYIGSRKNATAAPKELGLSSPGPHSARKASISILSDKAYVDPLAITQLENTANTLPGIIHAVAQPDLHPGTRFPIGAVFVSEGWIHPPLIGGDIGCGMAWYKLRLSPSQVEGDKGRRIAEKLRGLEGAWRAKEHRLQWLAQPAASRAELVPTRSAGTEFDSALGTIGAGNHFAEVQVTEATADGLWQDSNTRGSAGMLSSGDVLLLVHSGSRGYGGDVLKRYTADGLTSMELRSDLSAQYLLEHDLACAWADRNRDLIALRFLACLEPGDSAWALGINEQDSVADPADIQAAYQAVQSRKVVEICHNNMSFENWPPYDPTLSPRPTQRSVVIHRKGAAPISPFHSSQSQVPDLDPAFDSTSPSGPPLLPLLPLPGSRGTPTLVLHPTLSSTNAFGLTNALSLAHGAGRAISRAKAATSIAAKWHGKHDDLLRGDYARLDSRGNKPAGLSAGRAGDGGCDAMEDQERIGRQVNGGTWVVCEDKALVWEEAPEAYKDVWDVGADLVEKGAASVVGWCRARVSYKVRKE